MGNKKSRSWEERRLGSWEERKLGRAEEQKLRRAEKLIMEKKRNIKHFRDLDVYKLAFDYAMDIFKSTKSFPAGERYSMVDQIRRSSRSVCANLAEAWRKRAYVAVFRNKRTGGF